MAGDPDVGVSGGAPDPGVWRLGHRRALDGVRGLALVMVFCGHAGWPSPGNRAHEFGVELFFVLSGFLITSLLMDELRRTGRVDLRGFVVRRARRLLPALAVFVLGTVVWASTGAFDAHSTWVGALGAVTYSSGILMAAGKELGPFAHLWSLSVEEHFYIVWPLLFTAVAAIGRRVRGVSALPLATVLLAAAYAWRLRLVADGVGMEWRRMYTATDVRLWAPLAGSALGCWRAQGRSAGSRAQVAAQLVGGGVGVAVLVWLSTAPGIVSFPGYWTRALPLAGAAAVLVCWSVSDADHRLVRLLGSPPLAALGRLSYGAYLWHYPVFLALGHGRLTRLSTAQTASGVAISIAIAMSSERLVERRFRRPGLGAVPRPSPEPSALA